MSYKILTTVPDGTSSDGDPLFAETLPEALDEVRAILDTIQKGQRVEVSNNGTRVLRILCETRNN